MHYIILNIIEGTLAEQTLYYRDGLFFIAAMSHQGFQTKGATRFKTKVEAEFTLSNITHVPRSWYKIQEVYDE